MHSRYLICKILPLVCKLIEPTLIDPTLEGVVLGAGLGCTIPVFSDPYSAAPGAYSGAVNFCVSILFVMITYFLLVV